MSTNFTYQKPGTYLENSRIVAGKVTAIDGQIATVEVSSFNRESKKWESTNVRANAGEVLDQKYVGQNLMFYQNGLGDIHLCVKPGEAVKIPDGDATLINGRLVANSLEKDVEVFKNKETGQCWRKGVKYTLMTKRPTENGDITEFHNIYETYPVNITENQKFTYENAMKSYEKIAKATPDQNVVNIMMITGTVEDVIQVGEQTYSRLKAKEDGSAYFQFNHYSSESDIGMGKEKSNGNGRYAIAPTKIFDISKGEKLQERGAVEQTAEQTAPAQTQAQAPAQQTAPAPSAPSAPTVSEEQQTAPTQTAAPAPSVDEELDLPLL